MRKHLQIALMASPVIATFLSFTTPQLQAQTGFGTAASITAATDDTGRKIYVNDAVPATPRMASTSVVRTSGLFYWSPSAHHWKPVAPANIRAARSAAAEVSNSEQA